MEAALLYEHLAEPASRIERWAVKRRHAVADAELRSIARSLIADFEQLMSTPHVELQVTVSEVPDGEEVADFPEDHSAMNTLLALVRRCRAAVADRNGEPLRRALRVRMPELSQTYEDALAKFLDYLGELEKVFIVYGAGEDDDAALVHGVVPAPDENLRPGPSIAFEF